MNEVNAAGKPIVEICCFLCGSNRIKETPYLRYNSRSSLRNAAYLIPDVFARALANLSSTFRQAYNPVLINKDFFSSKAIYCINCNTGAYVPFFSEQSLSDYYERFYWDHRDAVDGRHIAGADVPNDIQIVRTNERLHWIGVHLKDFNSAIDFGSGDCAAAYVMARRDGLPKIYVVDPSKNAEKLSFIYGLNYFRSIHDAPKVDFIYSAHSIEHVHDLKAALAIMLEKLEIGGHVFIETPNIADVELFDKLPHTPHTFMLSSATFRFLETIFPIEIVTMSECGPLWRLGKSKLKSGHQADLRVLIRKTGSQMVEPL